MVFSWGDLLPQFPWDGPPIPRGPTKKVYYHGIDSPGLVREIVTTGLRAGSSVSDLRGQASAYGIIFEFRLRSVEPVYYRPGDYRVLVSGARPVSVMVIPEDFGRGVRSIEEINKDLAIKLRELEARGLSPEGVGAMSRSEQYKVDRELGELMTEMDRSVSRGFTIEVGGKGVLDSVVEQLKGTGIPVYRLRRDEEGEVDWKSKELVSNGV